MEIVTGSARDRSKMEPKLANGGGLSQVPAQSKETVSRAWLEGAGIRDQDRGYARPRSKNVAAKRLR